MKSRLVIGIALAFLLLAAAAPAYADLKCSCENGEEVETTSDDPADCDDACADLAGSRSVDRGHPDGRAEPDRNPTPPPDDEPSSRMP
jgi:hypothetical protein